MRTTYRNGYLGHLIHTCTHIKNFFIIFAQTHLLGSFSAMSLYSGSMPVQVYLLKAKVLRLKIMAFLCFDGQIDCRVEVMRVTAKYS